MKKPSQLVNEPDLEPKTLRDCVKNVIYSLQYEVRRKGVAILDFSWYDHR